MASNQLDESEQLARSSCREYVRLNQEQGFIAAGACGAYIRVKVAALASCRVRALRCGRRIIRMRREAAVMPLREARDRFGGEAGAMIPETFAA